MPAAPSLWLPPLPPAARAALRPTAFDGWIAHDGTPVFVRPLQAGDGALLRMLFDGLSRTARLRRFHAGVVALPEPWLDRLAHPDAQTEFALIALAVEDGVEVPIGEARYAVDDAPPSEREFALVVADDWQRHGIGSELMRRLEHHAREAGIRRLHGDVQHDNRPMLAMLERRGYALRRHPGDAGLVRASLPLAPAANALAPTLAELHQELNP